MSTIKILRYSLITAILLLAGRLYGQDSLKTLIISPAASHRFEADYLEMRPQGVEYPGQIIHWPTSQPTDATGYFLKAADSTNNWLFVFHEWWGMDEFAKKEAEKYWIDLGNVNILVIDLYDGRISTTRENAARIMQSLNRERIIEIIRSTIKFAGPEAKIATIGWSYGGGWALQAAIMAGKQAVGCIMYYGMPETDSSALVNLNTDVLGIFALRDTWINPTLVKKFEDTMYASGQRLEVKSYNAFHFFANPKSIHYDEPSAEEAYMLSLTYLRNHYK